MAYLFISDIHLGSPMFKMRDELIKLMSDPKYDKIFILGDVIDEWESDIDTILKEYSDVIECINSSTKSVIFIKGNHDPDPIILKSIFPGRSIYFNYSMQLGSKKVLMIHGHEFDFIILRHITLAKFLFPIQWVCERFGFSMSGFLRDLYHSFAEKFHHKKYDSLVYDAEYEAVNKYKDYDILMMGHTHKEKLVKLDDGRYYINTGSFVHHPAYVEFDNNIFTIRKFDKG